MQNRPAPAPRSGIRHLLRQLLARRIWIPAPFYVALPFLYLLLGALALASGIWLPDPGWILGYLLLISAGCVHAGLWLLMLRRRHRHARLRRSRMQRSAGSPTPDPAHRL
jgi:hypothetical protein